MKRIVSLFFPMMREEQIESPHLIELAPGQRAGGWGREAEQEITHVQKIDAQLERRAMQYKIDEARENFKFELSGDDLPFAHVTRWGNGCWIVCCPLCGCVHDTRGLTWGEFEPRCQPHSNPSVAYTRWLNRFPESTQYWRVQLVPVHIPSQEVSYGN